MRNKSIFAILTITIITTACVARYQQTNLTKANIKLNPNNSILIATPKNGFYGTTEYTFSGTMTAMAIHSAFSHFTNKSKIDNHCRDMNCLKQTTRGKFDYLVVPEILHWEDRATEWSGKPDRIEIKLSIYNAKTGTLAAATIIKGTSKWATFGGDHPQDLLPDPLNKYILSLY